MSAAVTLGERLKSAREAKGLSAQKVADKMHLDGWVVEALESGDYLPIGPPVYVKGHLKRYAELLALPPAEILEAYAARAPASTVAAAAEAAPPPALRLQTTPDAVRPPVRASIAALAVLALIAAGVYGWRTWESRTAAVSPPPSDAALEPEAAGAAPLGREAADAASGAEQVEVPNTTPVALAAHAAAPTSAGAAADPAGPPSDVISAHPGTSAPIVAAPPTATPTAVALAAHASAPTPVAATVHAAALTPSGAADPAGPPPGTMAARSGSSAPMGATAHPAASTAGAVAAQPGTSTPVTMAVHPAASSPVTMAAQSVAPTSGALTAHPAASNTLVTAAAHGAAQGAGDAGSAAGVGRARLRLSFSADSWVEVRDAAGKRLFAGQGRANSVRTIAGSAPMKVYLGFASGVQVQLNHHVVAIGPQFLAGDAARFEAGADGVLRRDAHDSTAGNSHPRG